YYDQPAASSGVLNRLLGRQCRESPELLDSGNFDDWVKGATSPGGPKLSCIEKSHIDAEHEM
ncbi:hypothetical protein DFQ27_000855, partial [Actinomortierella ambigua]